MPQPNQITIKTADNSVHTLPALGRDYSESSELIAREDRSAGGTLRRDITAEKKTFTLNYETIDNAALLLYEDLFENHVGEVLTLSVARLNQTGTEVTKQYKVLMRPFSRKRMPSALWQGVSIEFVEI